MRAYEHDELRENGSLVQPAPVAAGACRNANDPQSDSGRLCTSSRSSNYPRRIALSEMSLRHQAPGQRMHLTAL